MITFIIYIGLIYIIGLVVALIYFRCKSYTHLEKDERVEQLPHDVIVSVFWFPVLCEFGIVGIIYLVDKMTSK